MPTISHLSIYHNTDSGSAHSHIAKLRVGPDKEWDLGWKFIGRTNSNESHTHFSLFPLAQLTVTQANEIPPSPYFIAQAKGSGLWSDSHFFYNESQLASLQMFYNSQKLFSPLS